ncbi:protein FAR1-RELATED SEQUENCE 5-like [Lactuca sativa]|uniref:protein FAR1-RELATED SEQUENCE 5-like n=1 Tax=Lactuca sativa TaxID=4236 RepID=UPI0022B072C4|nr:protein FAR1-RELATED SEQUENCE 5-like [Lactuca sativa]
MSSLNYCSDLHSTINEQSLHDQSSSSMNIDHSNNSNSRYSFDFELYNTESFKLVPYDKLIHKKPFKGLLFDSLDIGLDFYKTYGQECGFDVNMSSQKRYNDGTIRIRYSTCSRSGFTESFKNENVNMKFSDVKRKRTSSKKNGCLAVSKFKNLRCSLMFYIYVFVEDHNHELVAQDQLHLLRINRTMDFLDESFIHKVGTCNIGVSKAYNLVSSMKGGFDSRGGTAVDFKIFHRDLNCKIGVKDSQMVVDILTNRKLCFSNFSFEFQKDVDDHLTGLFWADDTSKANYKEFGDVLSFDATYQTNNYSMVFVLFTGVDYHKRCVTFAAGLLARETADAYVWLLEVFRKAFVKPPMMIVTNRDSSMKKAVNFVFPESKHRLCMWHIPQKLEEKIPIDVYNHPDFQKTFFDIIWNLQCSPQDFESSWSTMLDKFPLKENDWLRSVFKIRDLWIPAFMRDLELSVHMSFDSAMEKQRHLQSLLDYQSTTTTPKLRTPLAIEKHASEIYTHNIFLDIQKELYKSVFYCVQESVVIEDESEVVFSRRGDSISISCSCMLFVQEGLLCRHMFFILNMKEYDEIPSNFILRRWGKDIIANGLLRKKYSYPHKGNKNECLIQEAYAILRLSINKIANNEDELAKYVKRLQEVDSGIPLCTSSRASSSRSVHIEKIIGVAVPDVINIHNPEGIRNMGWASGKRIKSTREKVIEKSKKGTRLCGLCHKPNHNARSCILRFKKSDLESEVTED